MNDRGRTQMVRANRAVAAYADQTPSAMKRNHIQWPRLSLSLLFALAYSATLAALPVYSFVDRDNYLGYANSSGIILNHYLMGSWITTLANEPVWLLINIQLHNIVSTPNVVRTIIFFSALITAFFLVYKNTRYFIVILFMLTPIFLTNYVVHIRQGVGLSIFLIGYYSNNKFVKYIFYLIAPLVHSSFFFIVMLRFMAWFSKKSELSLKIVIPVYVICFALLAFFLNGLASSLGARQSVAYEAASTDVSGIGFLIWFSVLLLFVTAGRNFLRKNLFPITIITFYLAVYFLTPVAGRIYESAVVFVFLAGLSLPRSWRLYFFSIVGLFSLATYAMRIGEPWLGFGV